MATVGAWSCFLRNRNVLRGGRQRFQQSFKNLIPNFFFSRTIWNEAVSRVASGLPTFTLTTSPRSPNTRLKRLFRRWNRITPHTIYIYSAVLEIRHNDLKDDSKTFTKLSIFCFLFFPMGWSKTFSDDSVPYPSYSKPVGGMWIFHNIPRALAWLHTKTISVTKHAPSCNVGETNRMILRFKYRQSLRLRRWHETREKIFGFSCVKLGDISSTFSYLLGSYKWKQQGYRTQIDIALSPHCPPMECTSAAAWIIYPAVTILLPSVPAVNKSVGKTPSQLLMSGGRRSFTIHLLLAPTLCRDTLTS